MLKDLNGTTIFNGGVGSNQVEGEPKNIDIAGVEFRYRQPDAIMSSSSITYLLTVGPIKQGIFLYVGAFDIRQLFW